MKILKLNKLQKEDIFEVALVHLSSIQNEDFLTQLDSKALFQMYHSLTKSKRNIILIMKNNVEQLVGFAFYTLDANNYLVNAMFDAYPKLIFNRSFYKALLKSIYKKLHYRKLNFTYNIELVQIAISGKFRGHGFAKEIIREGERYLSFYNVEEYYLQVYKNNLNAINLYESLNFVEVDVYNKSNKDKLVLRKKI